MARIIEPNKYTPWHLKARKDFTQLFSKPSALKISKWLYQFRFVRWSASIVPWSALCRFPMVMSIELTNRCNLQCVMCARHFMSRPEGDMDFPRFERIVNEMSGFQGTMLLFIGQGEPTLYPRFLDALYLAKSQGINRVLLQTNGMYLEKLAKDLVHAGLDELHVSMDGASNETFESIRRGSDANLVARGIHAVIAERKAKGTQKPTISLRYCAMPRNRTEMRPFRDLWEKVLGEDDEIRFQNVQYYKAMPTSDKKDMMPCTILWKRVFIRWNGDYAFCCNHMDNRLGLIESHDHKSIDQLWKDSRLETIRRFHLRGQQRKILSCAACALNAPGIEQDYAE